MTLHDYKGCLHVHSTASDGDSRPAEIIDAARDAGLDYVAFTEHAHVLDGRALPNGWHGGVLVAAGSELTVGYQHCVVLGIDPLELRGLEVPPSPPVVAEELAELRRRGALIVVAHPRAVRKRLFKPSPPGWADWHLDTFHGIEIWPYMHDWIHDLGLRNFLSHYRDPDRWITGPQGEILRQWDEIGRRRRCVGIGALDNHGRRFPFGRWGPALLEIFPHRDVFRTVRTHVLSPDPLSGDGAADLASLYALLRQGRCYVSYDLLADATGFSFEAQRQGARLFMGDEAPVGPPIELTAHCPVEARLTLLRDGEPIATDQGRQLAATAAGPGVYRVEAHLGDRPWIFSNSIYLRQEAASRQASEPTAR